MAAVIFSSKVNDDGSLTMPKKAVEELGLHPPDEGQARRLGFEYHCVGRTNAVLNSRH